jgi:hypothetical protein
MNKTLLVLGFSLFLGACATAAPEPTADNASSAIAAARHAKEKAARVGHEWRDTGDYIDDAIKAAEAQEYARAIELASLAKRQSLAALSQYKAQKNAARIN